MTKHQLRLLLLAGVTLGLMVASMFVVPWFKLTVTGMELPGVGGTNAKFEIDLRSVRLCGVGGCVSGQLSTLKTMFSMLSTVAFWANCVLAFAVAYQAGCKILGGVASESITRIGYLLAVLCFLAAGGAGFLFGPEVGHGTDSTGASVTVIRTWGPTMLVGADVLALIVLHMAGAEVFDTAQVASTPRVPSSPLPRVASSPLPRVGTSPLPVGTPRAGTANPASPTSASEPASRPSSTSFKPRSSSIPLDEATQADPTPATVPDRPPRTRAPSSVPFIADDVSGAPVLDPGPAWIELPPGADPIAAPEPAKPHPVLSFAVVRATISAAGISATRETGEVKQVAWIDIVGVVARRLPADPPYDGETFVDVVSTAGSTLRVLPWTQLVDDVDGAAQTSDGEERARALVQLVARRCPDAKVDGATRTFLGSRGHAAQLPNADTLAQHDARLA